MSAVDNRDFDFSGRSQAFVRYGLRSMSQPYFDKSLVAESLPFSGLIEHMEAALAHPIASPVRVRLQGSEQCEFLVMPALSAHYAGVKILAVIPTNGTRGLPVNNGLFVLMDATTGGAIATLDASELTGRRTAAVSALASKRLSKPDSASFLILGSGHIVPYLVEAHSSVREFSRISIWGRHEQKAKACRDLIQNILPNIAVEVAPDLATAAQHSDIICAATRAEEPLIQGKWIRHGTHVDLVGGYRPDMREIDDMGIAQASIYVDTKEGALAEAGDLLSPIERGVISESSILGDISSIIGGAGRKSDSEITLFKSVGSAAADLAAAELVWITQNSK